MINQIEKNIILLFNHIQDSIFLIVTCHLPVYIQKTNQPSNYEINLHTFTISTFNITIKLKLQKIPLISHSKSIQTCRMKIYTIFSSTFTFISQILRTQFEHRTPIYNVDM